MGMIESGIGALREAQAVHLGVESYRLHNPTS